ncbi:hypothetical protein [Botrimarina mediterranea]|uniref:hypothetical protein n=1 Tax=Botrimarina mediterranea TaxID=2528022 RepID=UPI0011889D41|nr:hypothetical protein K2D_29870 [Planctomycetes bacterium K2D]
MSPLRLLAALLFCASTATAQNVARTSVGSTIENGVETYGCGANGDGIIVEPVFHELDCVPQEFPAEGGPVPGDCNGNGIPDKYDSQPCGGEEANECADNPCAEGCPGADSLACGGEEDPDEQGGGDGVGVRDCTDGDGDNVCDDCDPDAKRYHLNGEAYYCDDEDEDGVCDDCGIGNCWLRIIDKLWWLYIFQNVSPRCEYYAITLDPDFGPFEAMIPGPIVSFTFNTCFNTHPIISNTRVALRGALSWIVSLYFWYLWWRFFWEM